MCRTSFHVCYYGSPHQGGPYQSLTGSCLLLYHLFHSLLCTIDVPMYTAGESVFYRRSDGSLVPATVLGPGAQSETVQIEYKRTSFVNVVKCGKGEGTHVPAQRAGNFFFRGTGLPTAVRKNQPLVPRSNIAGSWARGGGGTRMQRQHASMRRTHSGRRRPASGSRGTARHKGPASGASTTARHGPHRPRCC